MKRVLVTRPLPRAAELAARLAEHGIEGIGVPTVSIVPTLGGLADRLARLRAGDWLVVTSANGAAAVVAALGRGSSLPVGVRVAAVGPATGRVVTDAGLSVDYTPAEYLTLAIADGLADVDGRRVLLARSDAATPGLRHGLVRRGADVEEVVVYRTVEGPPESGRPLRAALEGSLDAIAFTSGSTVRGLIALLTGDLLDRARSIPAYCIGPVTAEVAEGAGFAVAAVAADHTADGLVAAIAARLAGVAP